MDISRRSVLAALAGAVIDPERLLWVPGRRVITFPRRTVFYGATLMDHLQPGDVVDCLFASDSRAGLPEHRKFAVLALDPASRSNFMQRGLYALGEAAQRQAATKHAYCGTSCANWYERHRRSPWPNRWRDMSVGL